MRSLFFIFWFIGTIQLLYPIDRKNFFDEIKFKNITTKDGLYKNNIKSIIQDDKGYIWFGGFGLYRYDGYEIKEYISTPNDKSFQIGNYVNELFVDSNNNIWIVCSNGIYLYERDLDRFKQIDFNQEIEDFTHTTLFEHDSKLFIVLDNIYYIPVYSNEFEIHTFFSLENDRSIDAAFFDDQENILYLSESRANLFYMDFNLSKEEIAKAKISFINSLKKDIISYIHGNEYYMVIAYKQEGIHVFNKKTSNLKHYGYNPNGQGINNNKIKSLWIEDNKKIWIGTGGGGINILDPSNATFTYIQNDKFDPYSLSNNIVLDIYKDKTGIIWVGTLNGGVNYFNTNQKPFYRITNKGKDNSYNLSNNVINDLIEDGEGNIWISTDKGGINVLNVTTGKIKQIKHDPTRKNSLSSNNILSLARDETGYIWIGTWGGGLNRYDQKNNIFKRYLHDPADDKSLAWNNVWALHVDKKNNLWIGLNNNENAGLDLYDRKSDSFIHYGKKTGDSTSLILNSIEEIFSDSKGNLWLGTTGNGLERLNKEDSTFVHYRLWPDNKTNNVHGLIIRAIFEDSNNRLWIGTEGGGLNLYDYKKDSFTIFTTEDGLPSNIISSILEDDKGNLWLGTSKGMCKFDANSFTTLTYNPVIDLKGSQFTWGAVRSKKGMMYFGTLQGVVAFNPDSITKNHLVPPVEITGFFLSGQEVGINQEGSILTKHISQTDTIILNHKQKIFSFKYVALNYINPFEIQYAYKLEGLEKKWNKVRNIRYATYTNLEPGNYTFMVKASNNEGVWGDNVRTVKIVILPPWWSTLWFRITALVILIALFLSLYRMRIATYKRRQKNLENKVEQRTGQLKAAMNNLKEKNEEIEQQKHSIEEKLHILEKQKAEIIKQKDEVMRISKKLHETDQTKLKLFTSISHEVRTPLTLILAPINSLIKITNNSAALEKLQVIQKNAKHLLNLINQLMDFRKLEASKMEIKPMKGDIVRFIKNLYGAFNLFASNHQINYTFTSNTNSAFCMFDPDIIEKILYNLLSNAFKFTPFKGEIIVFIKLFFDNNNEAEKISISVKDNGKGIPEDEIPHLFTRFYRANSNKSNYPGTGIGLSFVKSLVDLYNGKITVESSPGKGSNFIVDLPLTHKNQKIQKSKITFDVDNYNYKSYYFDQQLPKRKTDIKDKNINPDAPVILIVEDNTELREYIRDEFIEQFNVHEAENGEEGVAKAKEIMPDLIISDLLMPKMTGSGLCQRIKEDAITNHIPVIMLTAVTSDNKKLESFTKGADAYITKPFNSEELIIRAKNLIDSRKKIKEKVAKELIMQPEEVKINSSDDKFLKQTMKIIEEHISDTEFTVDYLASQMGMSNSQFYLKLMAITNHSPLNFIRKIRLKRAVQLMKTNEYRISEIAYNVGFQDPKYFTKIFKKEFKMTPSEYIKKL